MAQRRFNEAREIVPIRLLCVDLDERGRLPVERTQTRSSLSCSRIRSIGRAGFLRIFMARWSSRSSSAQALPSAAGPACPEEAASAELRHRDTAYFTPVADLAVWRQPAKEETSDGIPTTRPLSGQPASMNQRCIGNAPVILKRK
jgi:hypothetical protein